MERNWLVVYGKYEGLEKKALNLIHATVFDFYKRYLPFYKTDKVTDEILEHYNLILVGTVSDNMFLKECMGEICSESAGEEQSFFISVKASKWNRENQMILICGCDERGVLYGAVDFMNKYCGSAIYKTGFGDMEHRIYFEKPFHEKLPEWELVSSPSVKERAIWTWGHTIYDYKAFLEHMVLLKLNEIVIWNDFVPINADDIVDYAHSLGIKVIWGFAWGWDTDCRTSMGMTEQDLSTLKESIVNKFEREYAGCKGDGIYFQSCTELYDESIGGKLIAEVVVDLVNRTGRELLKRYPDLRIQFGLHANSVKNRLEYIAKVDERITIVWENCGEFPFFSNTADHRNEKDITELTSTLDFLKQICTLRGASENIGFVLKGMTSLDWSTFRHQDENIIVGENSKAFIASRTEEKHKIWKLRQANWVYNCDNVQRVVSCIVRENGKAIVQGLIEDGMFESEISLPAAIYAEILWNCNAEAKEITAEVLKFPCVKTANL